ncbi:MAG: hypothetical protein HUJ80_07105 [Firmicutes bacterium]|nr:hypothetical protein [Bacillota bacterium]
MNSPAISQRTWRAIYRLLDRVSPVDYDCGTLCGAACCCAGDPEKEMGIYLLPGEEKLHQRCEDPEEDWLLWREDDPAEHNLPENWPKPAYFVRCKTPPHCPRQLRPFQCRTFPLKPFINGDGILELVYNREDLPYQCPLVEDEMELNEDFIRATYTVWYHLLQDPAILEMVAEDSDLFL